MLESHGKADTSYSRDADTQKVRPVHDFRYSTFCLRPIANINPLFFFTAVHCSYQSSVSCSCPTQGKFRELRNDLRDYVLIQVCNEGER